MTDRMRDAWWRSKRRIVELLLVLIGIAFAASPDGLWDLLLLLL